VIDVARPSQAPASLAEGKGYAGRDVLEALHAAFLEKCYLCETCVAMGTFQVDHRKPKGDARFDHLEHAWENLFPVCNEFGCNQRRPKTYPEGGMLSPGDGVEHRIVQKIEGSVLPSLRKAGATAFVFLAADPADTAAKNTAHELDRIHNGTGSSAVEKAAALRLAIVDHVVAVTGEIFKYLALADTPGADAGRVEGHRWKVQRLVSRRAPYAMLVRSLFVEHGAVRALFD
jgi:hypothetical protein